MAWLRAAAGPVTPIRSRAVRVQDAADRRRDGVGDVARDEAGLAARLRREIAGQPVEVHRGARAPRPARRPERGGRRLSRSARRRCRPSPCRDCPWGSAWPGRPGCATTVRAPLSATTAPLSAARRRALPIRSACTSAIPQPRSRAASPGCGVRSRGAGASRQSPRPPVSAVRASASTTIGRATSRTSVRTASRVSGSRPIPGPMARASMRERSSTIRSTAFEESVRAAVSGRGSVIGSGSGRRDHRLLRCRGRARHQTGARTESAETREHGRARSPDRARDHEEMPVRFPCGRRSADAGEPPGRRPPRVERSECPPRAMREGCRGRRSPRGPHAPTPSGWTSPSFGSPKVTVDTRPDHGARWRLPVGGEPRGQVEGRRAAGGPRALMASIAAAIAPVAGPRTPVPSRASTTRSASPSSARRRPNASPAASGASATRSPARWSASRLTRASPVHVGGTPDQPRGDAGSASDQVAGHDEAVSAVVALAADDRDPAARRPGRARARARQRRRGPHSPSAGGSARRSGRSRGGPPAASPPPSRAGSRAPAVAPDEATLTTRSRPRRGPAPLPARHRG